MAPVDTLRIRVVSTPEEIRNEWLLLEQDKLCNFFQSYMWMHEWCTTYAPSLNTETYMVLVSDKDTPLMILPLCIMLRDSRRVVEFCNGGITDYTGPVLSPQAQTWSAADVATLFDRILKELPTHDCVALHRMTADINGVPNPLMLLPHVEVEESTGWARPLNTLQSEELQPIYEAEKKEKKLLAHQRTVELRDDPSDDVFNTLADWKRARFPQYLGPLMVKFYLNLLHQGNARLFHLYIDGTLVAAHYTIPFGKTCTGLILGYDLEWKRESPGKIILNKIFKLLPREGFTTFDQGSGNEAYKDEYGPGHRKHYRYIAVINQKDPSDTSADSPWRKEVVAAL